MLLVVLEITSTQITAAQSLPVDVANLSAKGKRCYRQRDYRCALAKFEVAFAAAPTPERRFNLASAQDKLGLAVLAFRQYRLYLKEGGPSAQARVLLYIKRRLELLAPQVAQLELHLVPSRAKVSINGTPVLLAQMQSGESRFSLVLGPGVHQLDFTHAKHRAHRETLTLSAGKTRVLTVTLEPLPRATTGELKLSSRPQGARVVLDGKQLLAQTPTKLTGLSPGKHHVRLATAKRSYLTTVTIEAGKLAHVDAQLQPHYGAVKVTSQPLGAAVLLDGQHVGKTPLMLPAITAGDHVVELRHAKMKRARLRLSVSGLTVEPLRLNAKLTPLAATSQRDDTMAMPLPVSPRPIRTGLPQRHALLGYQYVEGGMGAWALNVVTHWTFFSWLQLGADMPLLVHDIDLSSAVGQEVTGLGNIQLHVAAGQWRPGARWGGALYLEVLLPTAGDYDDVHVLATVAGSWRWQRFTAAVNAGFHQIFNEGPDWRGFILDFYGSVRLFPRVRLQTALQTTSFLEPKMAHPAMGLLLGVEGQVLRHLVVGAGVRLGLTGAGKLAFTWGGAAALLLSVGYQP